MTHTIKKHPDTHYVDYIIQDNKCYVIEEYHNRVLSTYICDTNKDKCQDLVETEKEILITI